MPSEFFFLFLIFPGFGLFVFFKQRFFFLNLSQLVGIFPALNTSHSSNVTNETFAPLNIPAGYFP